ATAHHRAIHSFPTRRSSDLEHETMEGVVKGERTIAASDWKWCGGGTFDAPVALMTLPVQICLKGGFDAAKLYQVVYTAKDPVARSEEHTSELQSQSNLVCRL